MTALRRRLLGCDRHGDTMLFRRTGVSTEVVRAAVVSPAFFSRSYEDLGNAEQPHWTQNLPASLFWPP